MPLARSRLALFSVLSLGVPEASLDSTEGSNRFMGVLDDGDGFGSGSCAPGDFDGDGRPDLVVGAPNDDDGGTDRGAIWVLSLNDGTLFLGANATTWDGSTDSDWTDSTNWSNDVPDSSKTAIIPDARHRMIPP